MTLIPYYELWKVIRTAVNGENPAKITGYAWSAVGLIIGTLFVYIAALLCTHIAAFRVQANMRTIANANHIVVLKDGVVAEQGSPKALSEYDSIYSRMTKQQLIAQNWSM